MNQLMIILISLSFRYALASWQKYSKKQKGKYRFWAVIFLYLDWPYRTALLGRKKVSSII